MTERARLTDALALAARPREREYAIHDATLRGFMLRVQPDGARSWVFRFRRDGKPRRVTLGKPGAMKADQARAAALGFLAREKGGGKPLPPPASGPTLTKFAAEYMERRSPAWKPSTRDSVMSYLDSAILPALGHLRVGAVARADVARFFHEYGRSKPGGANRCHEILRTMFDCAIAADLSMPVLSVIMREAEAMGLRPQGSNPCLGIRRYRRKGRARFLSDDEMRRLSTIRLTRAPLPSPAEGQLGGRLQHPKIFRFCLVGLAGPVPGAQDRGSSTLSQLLTRGRPAKRDFRSVDVGVAICFDEPGDGPGHASTEG